MRVAVVDLGSNTMRMSVYDEENGDFRIILSQKELIGLIGYAQRGILSEDGIVRVIETLRGFRATAQAVGAENFCCFATAGLRGVKNAESVVRRAAEETGTSIRIISGEEEARLDFTGAWRAAGADEGLMADLGGGSMEVVLYGPGGIENTISLPFGSLFLFKRYVAGIIPRKKELKKIRHFAGRELGCLDWLGGCSSTCCLIGGTARAIGRLHRELAGRQREELQGYSFDAGDLRRLLRGVYGETGVKQLTRVVPERIHTIVPGLAVFIALVDAAGCKTVTISRNGVREGYLREYLLMDNE